MRALNGWSKYDHPSSQMRLPKAPRNPTVVKKLSLGISSTELYASPPQAGRGSTRPVPVSEMEAEEGSASAPLNANVDGDAEQPLAIVICLPAAASPIKMLGETYR